LSRACWNRGPCSSLLEPLRHKDIGSLLYGMRLAAMVNCDRCVVSTVIKKKPMLRIKAVKGFATSRFHPCSVRVKMPPASSRAGDEVEHPRLYSRQATLSQPPNPRTPGKTFSLLTTRPTMPHSNPPFPHRVYRYILKTPSISHQTKQTVRWPRFVFPSTHSSLCHAVSNDR
jgi:hypothetical protein